MFVYTQENRSKPFSCDILTENGSHSWGHTMKPDSRVLIVQPCLPEYRVPLFDGLFRIYGPSFKIICGQFDPATGATSTANLPTYAASQANIRAFFGNRLFWQELTPHVRDLEKGDVLVVNGNPRYLSTLWWTQTLRLRGVRVLWWGHGWTPGSNRIRALIRRQLMKAFDAILLYTEIERTEYLHYGFKGETLFAANNALDQTPIVRERNLWTPRSAMSQLVSGGYAGRPFIIFSSRLIAKARLDQALQALAASRTQGLDIGLVVVGDGPKRAEWEARAKQLQVPVTWLGAVFDQQALAPWFSAATAFVYPGAIGLSLLHAFGYGLPVIIHSNTRGHNPEVAAFSDMQNGVSFVENDIESLTGAIVRLFSDSDLREALSRNAIDTVSAQYSMPEMIRRVRAAIDYLRAL